MFIRGAGVDFEGDDAIEIALAFVFPGDSSASALGSSFSVPRLREEDREAAENRGSQLFFSFFIIFFFPSQAEGEGDEEEEWPRSFSNSLLGGRGRGGRFGGKLSGLGTGWGAAGAAVRW